MNKLLIVIGDKKILDYFPKMVRVFNNTTDQIDSSKKYNVIHLEKWNIEFYQVVRYLFDVQVVVSGKISESIDDMSTCPKIHFISSHLIKTYGKYYLRYLSELFNYPMLDKLN